MTYLLYLALQPLDPLLQVVVLTVECHQLQTQVGALTLQLVRLRLKALRLQAQMTVLLQQVGALLLLETHRQTGLDLLHRSNSNEAVILCVNISNVTTIQ